MEYISIVDPAPIPAAEAGELPPFYVDLNLDQVVRGITQDWGDGVKALYERLPEDLETQEFRREVFLDAKGEGLREVLLAYRENMELWEKLRDRREEAEDSLQRSIWYIREVHSYCIAMEELKAGLEREKPASKGLGRLLSHLQEYLGSRDYVAMYGELEKLQRELAGFRVLLTYDKDGFQVSEGSGEGEYESFLAQAFPNHGKTLQSPFLAMAELSSLELEILRAYRKSHGEFFKRTAEFYREHTTYFHEEFNNLYTELGYYLSFLAFRDKLQEFGCEFTTPDTKTDALEAEGLYDLALAMVNCPEGKVVVCNDVTYGEGGRFFVVTGPNQGGKTTFARSLGQLVYFTKMGLDVAAGKACVPYFTRILTHFSVEESVETGRGKLMDELVRLAPMMEEGNGGAFVVINELFTTAANYDACIMGSRVLKHFISQGCRGIYVTHLNELTRAHEGVVSLRAILDEQHHQTFRIEPREARELAGAGNQVKKYKLSYEQIKERFA